MKIILLWILMQGVISAQNEVVVGLDTIVEIGISIPFVPIYPQCSNLEDGTEMIKCSNGKIQNFINHNLKYPRLSTCFEGTAIVQIQVNNLGKTIDYTIVRGFNEYVNYEVKRVVDLLLDEVVLWYIPEEAHKYHEFKFYIPVKFGLQ